MPAIPATASVPDEPEKNSDTQTPRIADPVVAGTVKLSSSMTPKLTSEPEIELPLVATRSKAAAQVHRQSAEGLKFADEADDLRILPGVPSNFPTHLGETEIVPYMANYRGEKGEDEFGGHPLKAWLTPLTYEFCQQHEEFQDYPRSHFNAENIYQYGSLILCVIPKVTYDKYVADNPGTAELMRRRLNTNAKILNGEIISEETQAGTVPGVEGSFVSTISRLGQLDHAGALKMMRAAS